MNYITDIKIKALDHQEYSVVLDNSIHLVAERIDVDGVWTLLTENGTIIGDGMPYNNIHTMVDTYSQTIFKGMFDVHVIYEDSRKNFVKKDLFLAEAIQEEIKRTRERNKNIGCTGKYPKVQIHKSRKK